ncbi:MAG: DUF58 domain-containing protein [Candidatus Omnitrophica bacterium]|nr:DUF58 domain-containing protein [Candidatus Omnitrophota bacterium]
MLRILLKKWIFLFIIIIFDLIIGLRTAADFFYFFFWFLLSVVALSLIWVLVEYIGATLHLERKIPRRVIEDDILELEAVIKNKSILPLLNLVLEDNLSCAAPEKRKKWALLEYLGPSSSVTIKYSCECPLRGKYRIGPFSIFLFDPLGLFFLKKTFFVYSELYVYPRIFEIPRFPELVKGIVPWFGMETSRVSGDEHEFYGVREYQRGDPIKKIHWLSTARKNKLIVKLFQKLVFYRTTIIFNLNQDRNYGEGKKSVVEYTVKIAASVAKYLIDKGISVEIIAHTGEIVHMPFNKGQEHMEDIFKFLAVAQAESKIGMDEMFQEFSRHIPNDSSLVIIMLDMDWEYLFALLALKGKNISLVPLILISSSFLHPLEEQVIKDSQIMKLPKAFNFMPVFFSCGANLSEAFIKY